MPRAASLVLPTIAAMLLAGCGAAPDKPAPPEPIDAAVVDALADPLMTDPDLTWQNQADAAITVAGPVSSALPPIDRSDAAIAAARDAATELAGGIPAAPSEPAREDLKALRAAITAAQMAQAAKIVRADCVAQIAYTARWAAVLPEPLQLYPRGAVEEAAGTDAAGCALRVVQFKTPVPLADVLAFHNARLRAAGYGVTHGAEGEEHVLRARKGGSAYLLYLRPSAEGLTVADVVVAE